MKERQFTEKISILRCPRFWREKTHLVNLRTNSYKGDVKYDVEWGICITMIANCVKQKTIVKEFVNIETFVNYM